MSTISRIARSHHHAHGVKPVRVLIFALVLLAITGAVLGTAAGMRAWVTSAHDRAVTEAVREFGEGGVLYVKANTHTAILPDRIDGREIRLVTEKEFVKRFRGASPRPYLIEVNVTENFIHGEFPYLVKYEIYISRTDTIASHLSLLAHMNGAGHHYTYNCSMGPGELVDQGGWVE